MKDLPEVIQVNGLGYIVPSLSNPGYLALVEGTECSCIAGQNGAKTCRHREAVRNYCAEQSARFKRPSVPPNISAMVD